MGFPEHVLQNISAVAIWTRPAAAYSSNLPPSVLTQAIIEFKVGSFLEQCWKVDTELFSLNGLALCACSMIICFQKWTVDRKY